jgi:hypothetical protein
MENFLRLGPIFKIFIFIIILFYFILFSILFLMTQEQSALKDPMVPPSAGPQNFGGSQGIGLD